MLHPNPISRNCHKVRFKPRKAKSLCFYCDEKYVFSHKCKASVHVLIVLDSEDMGEEEHVGEISTIVQQPYQDSLDMMVSTPQISLHAMLGVFFSSDFEI